MVRWRAWYPLSWIAVVLALAAVACNGELSAREANPQAIETKPLVQLLAPVDGSVYAEGTQVEFMAIAQDSLAGVARLEFRVDDFTVGEVTASDPAGQPSLEGRAPWQAAEQQNHIVNVEAFRADGSSLGESQWAGIKVAAAPGAPTTGSGGESVSPPSGTASAATAVPTPTEAPPPPVDMGILTGPIARSTVPSLVIRQGPGTEYPMVGELKTGEQAQIVGRNADGTWWAIKFGAGTAWIFAELTATQGDTSQVPFVAAP